MGSDALNEDWLKTMGWDLWTPGYEKLVDTVDELLAYQRSLGYSGSDETVLRNFLRKPASLAMPDKLVRELELRGLRVGG